MARNKFPVEVLTPEGHVFSDEVEKFIPPRKGRSHVLRVIREVLFFEPKRLGTDLNAALEFLMHVTRHRAVAVVISDFIGSPAEAKSERSHRLRPQMMLLESLAQAAFSMLRQTNRRHDLVAVQITDRHVRPPADPSTRRWRRDDRHLRGY